MSTQDYRELIIDKFTFRVKNDLWYNRTGIWAAVDPAANVARVGLGDFRQQSSGDIAFVEILPAGTAVVQGSEIGNLETVKVDLEVPSPVTGSIVRSNPALTDAPELINQDPYGAGWLAEVRLANWDVDRANLLDAAAYFEVMRAEAGE
jgi:glycine cleavage system H protein